MLRSDLAALQSVKADEPTSLPELISKPRQTAVDLGSQAVPTVGGNTNTRHHIRVAQARLNQTAAVTKRASELRKSYRLTVSAADAKRNPQAYAHHRMQEAVRQLPDYAGNPLRNRVAEILYYKALTTTDYTARQKGLLKNAVQAETMLRQRDKLMNTPAFKRLAALPDDELRQLAGQDDGEQLKRRYIRELARDKESEIHEQARQEKAEPALQNQARRQEARDAQQGGPAIGKQ